MERGESTSDELPFTSHLEELRRCLMISAGAWLACFLGSYAFAEKLFGVIATPVRQALPEGQKLVFITVTELFFTYFKVAALAGLLIF